MHPGRIEGATRSLGPPPEWAPSGDTRCMTLAIRDEVRPAGHGMTSAWFPTREEIDRLICGAPIYLTVIGINHPPVALTVGSDPNASI